MSVTQRRIGPHRCALPNPLMYGRGDVVECDECGLWWRNVQPGNPAYATWRRATLARLWAGLRR